MPTTHTTTRSYAQQITALLHDRPGHDSTPAERAAWLQRKAELLAVVEAVEAAR